MKLFRSIFIAVIVIVPGLARGEVAQFPKEYTMDAANSPVFYNSMIQQLCVGGDGTMVFMGLQAIRINCTNGWKNNAKPTQAEFDKAYDTALSTAGIGNSAAEKSTKNTGTVVSRNTTSRGGSASVATSTVPASGNRTDYTVVGNKVRYTGAISDWDFVNADLNAGGRKAFDNHLTEKFCMTTAGNNVTVDQAGIVITCNTIKPESMRPNSLLEEYYYALCRGKCADGGGTYSGGSGTGDGCVCKGIVKPEPIPEYDAEKLERLNAQVARQADKSISKDVKQLEQESDKELKKDLKADSRQLDKDIQTEFNDIDESTEKLTDELNRQKFESDMEQAAIDDALISVDEINSESDKELKKDLKADSRQLDKGIQTEFNDIDESTEKLTDELNRQKFESDMEQAAIDDALISVDEIISESDKELQKQLECESKNPPKAAKKNFLGIWVCVDTQETVDARKAARATNKILNAFWNEMEDLERAFNKRVRQLRRDAKRDGDDK